LSLSCVPHVASFSGLEDKEKQNKTNQEKLATWGTQDKDKQCKNNPEKLVT
jgi:hypothetical protein